MSLAALAADLSARARGRARFVLAIAGAPGAGKSTFAEALLDELERQAPGTAALLPMDGYHLDNALLAARGIQPRKGSPDTFDVAGLAATLARLRAGEGEVIVPVFDRGLDVARAGARSIRAGHRLLLVEGNYLLLDQAPWDALAPFFDRTLYLAVDVEELRRRLVDRWLSHGLDPAAATARAEGNDLANARLVATRLRPPDLVWRNGRPE